MGFAWHDRVDQGTRPAKKVFAITDEGRLVFLEWLASPVMDVRHCVAGETTEAPFDA